MNTYSNSGFDFDVSDTGQAAGRVVIALHGFPEDRHCWESLGATLSDAGYRVLAPDQRGYSPGARPAARREYSADKLRGDVIALADAAGADRFDVVGHDWGGFVAWDLAARCPDRVRTVTALSTPHPRAMLWAMGRSTQVLRSWYMLFFQLPAAPERLLALQGRDRGQRLLQGSGLDPGSSRRYAERFSRPGAMTGPINWYRALVFGWSDPTPAVGVPALYVWGERDRFLTAAAARRTAAYVRGPYRFEVLRGASHWLPSGESGRIAPMLLEHLAAA